LLSKGYDRWHCDIGRTARPDVANRSRRGRRARATRPPPRGAGYVAPGGGGVCAVSWSQRKNCGTAAGTAGYLAKQFREPKLQRLWGRVGPSRHQCWAWPATCGHFSSA